MHIDTRINIATMLITATLGLPSFCVAMLQLYSDPPAVTLVLPLYLSCLH